jgi:hypothetical protein
MRYILVVLSMLAVLSGCASGGGSIDPKDESVSLVYGYFDMKDAPTKADWVWLRKYDAKAKEAEGYNMGVKEGVFFHVGIEPGSYQVDRFGGGGGFFSRPVEYNFGGRGRNATAVRIAKPGAYFLGSHRYVNHAGKGFFDPDRFEMQAAKAPGEKEVLRQVIERLESDPELKGYTRQLQLARKRLGEL